MTVIKDRSDGTEGQVTQFGHQALTTNDSKSSIGESDGPKGDGVSPVHKTSSVEGDLSKAHSTGSAIELGVAHKAGSYDHHDHLLAHGRVIPGVERATLRKPFTPELEGSTMPVQKSESASEPVVARPNQNHVPITGTTADLRRIRIEQNNPAVAHPDLGFRNSRK